VLQRFFPAVKKSEDKVKNLMDPKCIPFCGGQPTLTDGQIATLKPQMPEWELVEKDGVKRLIIHFWGS
jgi:hypothetical protein